jgi:hypothetical protein
VCSSDLWNRYSYWDNNNHDSLLQDDYLYSGIEQDSEQSGEQNTAQDNELVHVRGNIIRLANELFANNPEYKLSYRNSSANVPAPQYTYLDEESAQWLLQVAAEAGISADAERSVIVDQVARYVRSAADYTLTPGRTPENDDFVRHFLETSQEGYCIHFATAATLMLRSFDIPARFTSGFLVIVPFGSEGEIVSVTDRYAHAWVEVFYDDIGWIPLEVTPPTNESITPARLSSHTPALGGLETEAQVANDAANPEAAAANNATPTPDPNANGESATQRTGGQSADDAQASLRTILVIVAPIVVAAVVISAAVLSLPFLWRRIVRKTQERRLVQKDNNAAVASTWNYICRLIGRNGEHEPNQEIEALAQKARFSQHTISDDELATVLAYSKRLLKDMNRSTNAFGKLRLKYVRGLYNLSKFI